MSDGWHDVGAVQDVAEDEPIAARIDGHAIAVHMVAGQVYALDDICPHAFVNLSDGFADGEELTCPKHLAVFHIPTGRCLKGPRRGAEPELPPLTVHGVRVDDAGRVHVKLARAAGGSEDGQPPAAEQDHRRESVQAGCRE